MVIPPWVFGRCFLSEMIVFVADDKMQAFKQKSEFWKTCICPWELDSFPIITDFSDEIGGEINECNVFLLYNEMCQHLEEFHNALNQYFPNHQSMMLLNYVWVKHPFKMYDTPMDFNTTIQQSLLLWFQIPQCK